MYISKINSTTNFGNKQKYTQKIIEGGLKDGSNAVVRLTFNPYKDITSVEGYQFKKGNLIHGAGFANSRGVDNNDLASFFERLQANASEGTNFFEGLCRAWLNI